MNRTTLTLLALAAIPAVSQAQVIFSDSWLDGGLTNGADPADIGWYTTTSSSALEVGTGFMGLVTGGSGRGAHGVFTPQTLNVGDTLTMTFTFTTPTTVGSGSSNGIRIGLVSSLGKPEMEMNQTLSSGSPNHLFDDLPGYMMSLDVNTGSENIDFRAHDLAANLGRFMSTTSEWITVDSGGDLYSFVADTSYVGVLSLTRSGASEITLSGSISQGATLLSSFMAVDGSAASATYDMIGMQVLSGIFGSSSSPDTPDNGIDFTNIMVEYMAVPEPSMLAVILGGLALTMVFLRKRK